jgi:hypothetical protein
MTLSGQPEFALCNKCGARTKFNESATLKFPYGNAEECWIHHLPAYECSKCGAVNPAPGVGKVLLRLKEEIRRGHYQAYSYIEFLREQEKKP